MNIECLIRLRDIFVTALSNISHAHHRTKPLQMMRTLNMFMDEINGELKAAFSCIGFS